MTIAVAVVGHVARQHQAHRLTRQLGASLFLDNGELGEWDNHRRAWEWAARQNTNWSLVIQDDAQPVNDHIVEHLEVGVGRYLPRPGLVSLYLGTSYPTHWQRRIRRALATHGERPAWFTADTLLHGVAVAAPTAYIADMLDRPSRLPYDQRLGAWAKATGVPVYYTNPSLVDHDDQLGTLVDHPDGLGRDKPRRAWWVGTMPWNRAVVRL